jgi:hypothetical protein
MAFDPDEFLNDQKKKPAATDVASSGFDPDAFLATPDSAAGVEPAMVAGIAATDNAVSGISAVPQLPVSGYGPGVGSQLAGTQAGQMAQNAGRIMQPYAAGASKLMSQYANNPITRLAPDVLAAANLYPPPYATAQVIGSTQGAYNVARKLPGSGQVPGPVVPAPTPAQVAGNPMLSEMAARQAALQTESMANRTTIQKLAMSKVMQNMGQMASAAAPALNTAARVAGPAGAAYNLYEAGQMARETGLGSRLAQGQGQQAEQAFRNINTQYGDAFRNTVTAQQARDILASNSTRDIAAFGGAAFLRKRAGQ